MTETGPVHPVRVNTLISNVLRILALQYFCIVLCGYETEAAGFSLVRRDESKEEADVEHHLYCTVSVRLESQRFFVSPSRSKRG